MLWFRKKQDVKHPEVADVLFPDYEIEHAPDGTEFFVDRSVDTLLESALIDLRDGNNDSVVHDTISNVVIRLRKAKESLNVVQTLDSKKAKYMIVDTMKMD